MKTPIRRLDSLTHNDTAATKLINDNFEALQQGIEDALSRSGKTPNYMDASLDMNMNRIINIATPVDDYDLANKKYVDDSVANFQDQLDAEETRAKAAEKAITDTLDTYGDVVTHNVDEFATAAQGALADTALQPADLGDGTITINQNGLTVGTFTTNQSSNKTINLSSGTNTPANKYATIYISFPINTTTVETDVSSIVEDGVLYTPYVYIDPQHTETIYPNPSYNKSTKKLRILRREGTSALSFTAYVTFVASDNQSATSAVGLSTGQDYAGFNRSYSKSEDDILLADKQDAIDSSNMLDADLVDDSTSTNKFVTTSDKTTWSEKQDALTFDSTPTSSSTNPVTSGGVYTALSGKQDTLTFDTTPTQNSTNPVTSGGIYTALSSKQDAIGSSNELSADFVTDSTTTNKFVTASEKSAIGTALQPADISNMQTTTNLVTSVSSSSTDSQYPSAKLFYDTCGDIETLINAL
jgi:hypothetical protein